MKLVRLGLGVLATSLLVSGNAQATQFTATFRNATAENWSQGLASTSSLFTWGSATPQPGSPEYPTYAFVATDCDVSDAFCGAGCDDDGNATVLAQRYGLTIDVNAWIIPPVPGATQLTATSFVGCASDADCGGNGVYCAGTPQINAGTGVTWTGGSCAFDLTFEAAPSQHLAWVAKATNGATPYDFVAATLFGVPGTPSVPLFTESGANTGLPLDQFRMSLFPFGYNRVVPAVATSGLCVSATSCPVNPAALCFAGNRRRVTDAAIPNHSVGPVLTTQWTYTTPLLNGRRATTDGIAVGELQTGGGSEVLVVTNGGNYSTEPFVVGPGRAVVLNQSTGAERDAFTPSTGHDLLGFPMLDRFVGFQNGCNNGGGAVCQYVVGETGDVAPAAPDVGAGMLARNFDATSALWTNMWSSRPYGYPGYWNMGASFGDVRSDLVVANGTQNPLPNEVVVADLYGNVSVLRADNATSVNTYSTYTSLNRETVFGHAAVANVDRVAGNEVVLFGARTGRVIALKAPTPLANGPLTTAYVSDPLPTGGRAFANGPAIGDIDGDGFPEIVVVSGFLNQVFAFDPAFGTTCKYRWPLLSGHGYYYTSPVIGDVTGDTRREVVVYSSDSVLSVLAAPGAPGSGCTDGTRTWEYTVGNTGSSAWFTPALAQLTGSTKLDVVAANYQTMEIVNVDRRRKDFRFSVSTAQFYPSVAIQPGNVGGLAAFLHISGWANNTVYRLATPLDIGPIPAAWLTFMGNNQRTGAL